MFEFLFKYPAEAFSKGTFVFLEAWPVWLLFLLAAAAVAVIGFSLWRRKLAGASAGWKRRAIALWLLQSAAFVSLLLLLWQPAISVTTLKPEENIIAVVIDDSRSMSLKEGSASREEQAVALLKDHLLGPLRDKFQVRLYKLSDVLQRLAKPDTVHAEGVSTQIGKGLAQLADEASALPIGAIVLLSDGADTSGGVSRTVLNELQRRHIPVHTIGFGDEHLKEDLELERLTVAPKVLAGSRLEAQVTLRQNGFSGQRTRLTVRSGNAVVASREVVLNGSGEQTESVEFNAGVSGIHNIRAEMALLQGERNRDNNTATRVISVDERKRRILYIEGEPRWEYKFLRRAADDDNILQVVSMLRTTQNKIYRQGIGDPQELVYGFPSEAKDLFSYDALIIGSVEAPFFSSSQAQLVRDFVDRRGGGLLFLAGRSSLSDGGYRTAPFDELLPVNLPSRKDTFQRSFVAAELTEAGKTSPICRIEDSREKSIDHWEILPYLANYQDGGTPKPGAMVLANVNAAGKHLPLLVTQNYGHGRTALFATAGSWRWRMQQPVGDTSQETFWRQLLRWTVADTPNRVNATTPTPALSDDGAVLLRAEVRDKSFLPVADADVKAHIIKPDGSSETVAMAADPATPGVFTAQWNAAVTGSYAAEVSAFKAGASFPSDVTTFRREDGVAENFNREQNRDLLQQLSSETGGRYYTPKQAQRLPSEIVFSQAGLAARELKEIWNMPVVFLLLLAIVATEWLLRRRWSLI